MKKKDRAAIATLIERGYTMREISALFDTVEKPKRPGKNRAKKTDDYPANVEQIR
jgi:hypothetical protein